MSSSEPADALRIRLRHDPDAVLLSEATDNTLSIGRDVWRLRWKGQLTTAVASDAGLATTCGALLDVLALIEQAHAAEQLDPLLDLTAVNVLVDRPAPGTEPTETDEALRSLRDAVTGVRAHLWYRRGGEGWAEDVGDAPTWSADDQRVTGWVQDLLLPRLTAKPTALALDLLDAVDDPSLHLYPSEIRAGAPPRWALRIDGLEIGVIGTDSGTLTVGKPGASGDSAQRQTFIEVFGKPSVTVAAERDLQVAAAAGLIRELLRRLRAVDVRGAPVTHRVKNGAPIVDEHALEARLLAGIVPPPGEAGLVLGDTVVARGSQFPTLWGHTGPARYLDALLTRGTTPLAVELKVATGGQGRYYRRSLLQAVLYAHFIRSAPALDPWFAVAGVERSATIPVVGLPAPTRWTSSWQRRLDGLRAVAARLGAEVWVLDDRITPEWDIHSELPEPDVADLEYLTWRMAGALSSRWPRSLGRAVDTWPINGFYDTIELRHRDDNRVGEPQGTTRVAMNRPGSLWIFGPTGACRWVWRGLWNHLAAGGDLDEVARIVGAVAGLPAEQAGSTTFAELAATFLEKVDGDGWTWRCAWQDHPVGDCDERFRTIVRRYRPTAPAADPERLPTRARLWVALRDEHAAVLVDQQDLRVWAWTGTAPAAMTEKNPLERILSAAALASTA